MPIFKEIFCFLNASCKSLRVRYHIKRWLSHIRKDESLVCIVIGLMVLSCFLHQFFLSTSVLGQLPSPPWHTMNCTHTDTCTQLLSKKLLYLLNLSLSQQNLVIIPLGEQKKNLFLCAKFRVWINSPCLLHFSKCFLDGFIRFSVKTNSTETRLLSYPRPEFCDPDIGAEFHIWPKEKQGKGAAENTRHKMRSCEVCVHS